MNRLIRGARRWYNFLLIGKYALYKKKIGPLSVRSAAPPRFFCCPKLRTGRNIPTQPGDNMRKIVILCTALSACLGCGGKQNLENEISSLKQELRDCEYTIKDQRMKQRELRMEAMPKTEKRPPSPPYAASWHRAFSSLATRVRGVMGDREFDVGFKNGALVVFVPTSTFFAEGGKKITGRGQETIDALLEVLNEEQHRDVVVTVRSAELSRQGIGKRGNLDTEGSRRFNRALSMSRALEITQAMEDGGINPIRVIPAADAVDPDEESPAEDGMVKISLHPVGNEVPDFPEPAKDLSGDASKKMRSDDPDIEELE